MPKQQYYRNLFLFSAAWNLLLAGSALLLQVWQLSAADTALLRGWQFPIGYLYFVCLFGFGYYLVAKDIDSNHGVVILGILGKVGVFVIFMADYLWGAGDIIQTLIGAADLFFAVLFIEFLYTHQRHQACTVITTAA